MLPGSWRSRYQRLIYWASVRASPTTHQSSHGHTGRKAGQRPCVASWRHRCSHLHQRTSRTLHAAHMRHTVVHRSGHTSPPGTHCTASRPSLFRTRTARCHRGQSHSCHGCKLGTCHHRTRQTNCSSCVSEPRGAGAERLWTSKAVPYPLSHWHRPEPEMVSKHTPWLQSGHTVQALP